MSPSPGQLGFTVTELVRAPEPVLPDPFLGSPPPPPKTSPRPA